MNQAILSHGLRGLAILSWAALLLSMPQATAQVQEKPTIEALRVGLAGAYKLGCWTPVEVDLLGGTKQFTGRVEIIAPDSDGVLTSVSTASSRPVGINPAEPTTARLFVRIGRSDASLQVRFMADRKVRAKKTFQVGPDSEGAYITGGIPATNRLYLQFGPGLGLGELLRSVETEDDLRATFVSQLSSAAELPTQWYGYDGFETVFITTSEVELYRPLLQSTSRVVALKEWVERGGRLAIFCGAEAEELLGEGGVLADFVPGRFEAMVPLRQSLPIESFSESDEPLTQNRRLSLQVPKLADVRGQILVYDGSKPRDLPLVVRGRLGLGEVLFVGLDFDRQPLSQWKGRGAFLRKVLDWPEPEKPNQQAYGNTYLQSEDMTAKLRNALDGKFQGVTTVPFFLIGMLVVGYILLIGPGDYFLVSKLLKRTELTWITFPAIVVAVSAGAYFLANALKGDQFRINQVEIVDVDTTREIARGTVWTHFFSPRVETFDLSIQPSFLDSAESPESNQLVSWLGLPGYSQGGMQTIGGQTSLFFEGGYGFDDQLSAMYRVPVQIWSTKTIAADWKAEVESPLKVQLESSGDDLLKGQITNNSQVAFDKALLCYGAWAYYIGKIGPDAAISIDDELQPRTVKTSLTSATAGDSTESRIAEDGTVSFQLAQNDVARLVKSMMFFEAINGEQYTSGTYRYQNTIDLSHLLKQEDIAILVTRVDAEGSQWHNGDKPLKSDQDRHWTYYRFVLHVDSPNEDS